MRPICLGRNHAQIYPHMPAKFGHDRRHHSYSSVMKVRCLDSAVEGDPRSRRAGRWLVWRRTVAMDVWGGEDAWGDEGSVSLATSW